MLQVCCSGQRGGSVEDVDGTVASEVGEGERESSPPQRARLSRRVIAPCGGGEGAQQVIAGEVTMGVVEGLEVVEVGERDGERMSVRRAVRIMHLTAVQARRLGRPSAGRWLPAPGDREQFA